MRGRILLILLASALVAMGQERTYKMGRWGITPGDYSGITALGEGRYAVVTDKEKRAGFYVWKLTFDLENGRLVGAENEGFRGTDFAYDRDAEGIAFCERRGTVFVSGEADQRVVEHRLDGGMTGAELNIPEFAGKERIQGNRGFEALCYDRWREVFWTVTESALKGDAPGTLRLMCFGGDLQMRKWFTYTLEEGQAKDKGRDHYHGVVALAAEEDGGLLVLEREARIAKNYSGSRCWCKLFRVVPETGKKTLLKEWNTRFTPFNTRFANYEGMCLGPTLRDGRRTLLLLSDAQGGYGKGPWHLKDRVRVVVL